MTRLAFFFATVPTLVIALGCGPIAQGGGATGGSTDPSTTASAGGSSASSAGGADAGSGGDGGSGGEGAGTRPDPTGDPAPPCDVCASALGGGAVSALCGPSQAAFTSLLDCACNTTCAAVCGDAANCLDSWGGNAPLECKTCLVSQTGCGAAWNACLGDDGVSPPPDGSTSAGSGGGSCSCDPELPLCPGGGSCATPGAFDAPGNQACGSAQYCAPCCDPGNACVAQGACKVTKIAQEPCAANYECCSGVCTAGQCDGGCGIVLSF